MTIIFIHATGCGCVQTFVTEFAKKDLIYTSDIPTLKTFYTSIKFTAAFELNFEIY